ncbi:MAG: hypothetical protein EOO18_11345, partial [Chryseobacterium sp.]
MPNPFGTKELLVLTGVLGFPGLSESSSIEKFPETQVVYAKGVSKYSTGIRVQAGVDLYLNKNVDKLIVRNEFSVSTAKADFRYNGHSFTDFSGYINYNQTII